MLAKLQHSDIIDIEYELNAVGDIIDMNLITTPVDPSNALGPRTDSFSFDVVNQVSSNGFTYDKRGRIIKSPEHLYTWDGASHLISLDGAVFSYNGLDDLTTRTEGANLIHYYYNHAIDSRPVVARADEITAELLNYFVWTPNGRLLYMIDAAHGNTVYFYHFDHIGSTLALTNTDGDVTDSYAYTPYGELLVHNGTNDQPFTFQGRSGVRQEGESGRFYHMRARYYDALLARFLSPDPMGLTIEDPREINPYQYAAMNPIKYNDPAGLLKFNFAKILKIASSIKKFAKSLGLLGKAAKAGVEGVVANSATKGRGKNLTGLEAGIYGIICQIPGSEELLSISQGKRENCIGNPGQNLTEWLLEMPKYSAPEGATEYWAGGCTRDTVASPFTLGKFGLEAYRDFAWIARNDRESSAKWHGWGTEFSFAWAKAITESSAIDGLIEGCRRVEDGWTRIGEYSAYATKEIIGNTPTYSAGHGSGSPLPESSGITGGHSSSTSSYTGQTSYY